MNNKYLCIHGHFYQPPRENPWLESVEMQESAYPFHDWNARISNECYAPNTASRLLDPERKIIDIVNNYSRISFNFGPTLLTWMEKNDPEIYTAILEADKKSQELFSGHGAAIAQVYNHIIMPLAHPRDKWTQIVWGIADFKHRFDRHPEGMWLAESAVDLETLDMLAENGIVYTILAPRQASRVRKIDDKRWRSVKDSKIDPKVPYVCRLPSGRTITLFFYDGPISQDLAFGGLLASGEKYSDRLLSAFVAGDAPQLVHIATDGETYGHHHRHGDMALAYCLYHIEKNNLATITIYGEYLAKHPAEWEVEIFENSSWSCVHGVERWRNDCGCNSGMHYGWKQEWRAPLRGALDWLRDNLAHIFEEHAGKYLNDPWHVRNEYIQIILKRDDVARDRLLLDAAHHQLVEEEKIMVLKLLEMQRFAMYMYTSCGWFFDELSGIETVQILHYAARAIQLAHEASGISFDETFVKLLERAPSNIEQFVNGAKIYDMFVRPVVLDLKRVGVHFAISSVFNEYDDKMMLYSYAIDVKEYEKQVLGKQRLALGKIIVRSVVTCEKQELKFAVFYLGEHNVICGTCEAGTDESCQKMYHEVKEYFMKGQVSQLIKTIDAHFGAHSYSLWHLFRDEQHEILNLIFQETSSQIEISFRQIYDNHLPIIQAVEDLHIQLPRYFNAVIEFVLNADVRKNLESDEIDYAALKRLIHEVMRWKVNIDTVTIQFIVETRIGTLMALWQQEPTRSDFLRELRDLLRVLEPLRLELDIWKAQNVYFSVGKTLLAEKERLAQSSQASAEEWIALFAELGELLTVRIE